MESFLSNRIKQKLFSCPAVVFRSGRKIVHGDGNRDAFKKADVGAACGACHDNVNFAARVNQPAALSRMISDKCAT